MVVKIQRLVRVRKKPIQLFQKCRECGSMIKVPRHKVEFDGTPYYRWEFVDEVECPNCTTPFLGIPLPTKTEINIPPEMKLCKTKNEVLYAFDIGLSSKKKMQDVTIDRSKYEKQYNYVAIFQDCVKFLSEIFSNYSGECCDVCTTVDFEDNVETWIE